MCISFFLPSRGTFCVLDGLKGLSIFPLEVYTAVLEAYGEETWKINARTYIQSRICSLQVSLIGQLPAAKFSPLHAGSATFTTLYNPT